MSTIASRNVTELPEAERQSLERILGRLLAPSEKVYLIVERFPRKKSDAHSVRALHRMAAD